MTRETILLLIRHGLTAIGPILMMLQVTTAYELQAFTDAALEAAGALSTVIGLAWSFRRKWMRDRVLVSAKKE